ncbi:sulfotransferase [Frateuria sp. GZRR33]|uniref:sulfotransferase n=1 Tax=Frateuria sp. GZRR33 TaxID=3351535 RepID=UPI003EDC51E6
MTEAAHPEAHAVVPPSVCFVCEPGRLEMQALLLAASLREDHPDLVLVAATPRELPPATAEGLARLGVSCVPIRNPLAADYPIGNKVAALGAGEPRGLRVFLDSDMLCMRALEWGPLRSHAMAAKPADLATFNDAAMWERLYGRFDLDAPRARTVTTVSLELTFPYFNAGLVASTRAVELARQWERIARDIDAMDDIHPRRPWLDQIALPLAAAALDMEPCCLGDAWNYPAHIKPVQDDPYIVHYHHATAIARDDAMLARVAVICERHPWLEERLAAEPGWQRVHHALLRRNRTGTRSRWSWQGRRSRAVPGNLLITGVPRSGTSYLCHCLDRLDNLAVINEPQILFDGLRFGPEPWMVPVVHADLRAAIDAGEPVENKLDSSGCVTEDTAVEEARTEYRPRLRNRDWVMASKNTLAYMARLDGLLHVMPEARVAMCIRHPADTLASWKVTFAHLASGDPRELPVGGLADPYLPARHRGALERIAALEHPAWRRAAWWRMLAEEVLRWRDHPRVTVVRYEELVAHPAARIAALLGPLASRAGRPIAPFEPSQVRTRRRRGLDAEDWRALQALCGGLAAALGYHLIEPDLGVEDGRQTAG